jgi:DHA2 family multidrug resistance protein-like MFS transporter
MKARPASAVSFWVIGSWGGSGLCSFVGGAIATGLGWRWIFVFSIAVALVALLLLRGTPESRSAGAQQQKLDISGLLSLIASLVLLNLFISKGHGWGWSSGLSLTMFAGSLLAAGFSSAAACAKGRRAD